MQWQKIKLIVDLFLKFAVLCLWGFGWWK